MNRYLQKLILIFNMGIVIITSIEIINICKIKKPKIMKQKEPINVDLVDEHKQLYEWAEDQLFSDEVQRFLQYCRGTEGKEATDVVSYTEFLTLKEKFES